ncbi:MAG: hypothetical protein WC716_16615 [Chitinophagaceae bacterium]|jgi:hypothetical protein
MEDQVNLLKTGGQWWLQTNESRIENRNPIEKRTWLKKESAIKYAKRHNYKVFFYKNEI